MKQALGIAYGTLVVGVVVLVIFVSGCGKQPDGGGDPSKAFTARYLNADVAGVAKGEADAVSEREFHLAILKGAEE